MVLDLEGSLTALWMVIERMEDVRILGMGFTVLIVLAFGLYYYYYSSAIV